MQDMEGLHHKLKCLENICFNSYFNISKRGHVFINHMKGIIIKGLGGLYDIKLTDGSIVSCKAKGAFRHEKITPYAGDSVVLKQADKGVVVEEIIDRKNYLIRPPVANLDILFTVIAAEGATSSSKTTLPCLVLIAPSSNETIP